MKTCTKCQETKPLFAFSKMSKSKDGYKYHCKTCTKNDAKQWRKANPGYHQKWLKKNPTYKSTWYERNPGYRRDEHYKRKYGLTAEQVQQMVEAQQGKCAICNTQLQGGKLQAVDHCHTTDKVRAILCHGCNKGLGLFRDLPDSLRKAADYLEHHAAKRDE